LFLELETGLMKRRAISEAGSVVVWVVPGVKVERKTNASFGVADLELLGDFDDSLVYMRESRRDKRRQHPRQQMS
jgi:hypothetical protein